MKHVCVFEVTQTCFINNYVTQNYFNIGKAQIISGSKKNLEGWLYLASVMDQYSRKIVGWHMSDRMTKELVIQVLEQAFLRQSPGEGLLHHSDRGSQYASGDYQRKLQVYKMVASMSRKGNCYDNACLAWSQLKDVEQEIVSILERIGEAGDLSGFIHGNALLRHAGLNLAEASSGKWVGQMKISKLGRSRLRRFIFMMTLSLVRNNPEFWSIHAHNVQVKKMKKMRSIMKLCGKLVRILVGMARTGQAYYMPYKAVSLQPAA